tara:strand:- start:61 stop:321 length:261 start_codon:yes stop_codon:yes gene_type:complete
MPEIKFNITDTEEKCLNTVMVGIGTWADNAVTNRARIAQEDICSRLMTHCNTNGIAIATGIDAQITQAYAVGVAHTATDIADVTTP